MEHLTKNEERAWADLLERTQTAFDDQDAERFEKRKAVARKKLTRRGLTEAPIDRVGVQRFLLRYAECRDGEGYEQAVKASGVDKITLVTAYDLWPESKAVYEYVRGIRIQLQEIENEDLLTSARGGLKRLVTVEGCELNAKAVLTTVERLDRKHFGDAKSVANSGRAQVTYNCPGLTVNMIMAPGELAKKGLGVKAQDVVDVEVEG